MEQKNYRLDSTMDAILSWEPILQMKGDFPVPGLDERSLHFQRLSHRASTDTSLLGRDFHGEVLGQRDEYLVRIFVSSDFSSPVSLADWARLIGIVDAQLDALIAILRGLSSDKKFVVFDNPVDGLGKIELPAEFFLDKPYWTFSEQK